MRTAAKHRGPTLRFIPKVTELRVVRARHNLKFRQIAEDLGRNKNHLNAIFNGRHNPTESLARQIAGYFGRDVEDLFEIEDLETHSTSAAA